MKTIKSNKTERCSSIAPNLLHYKNSQNARNCHHVAGDFQLNKTRHWICRFQQVLQEDPENKNPTLRAGYLFCGFWDLKLLALVSKSALVHDATDRQHKDKQGAGRALQEGQPVRKPAGDEQAADQAG